MMAEWHPIETAPKDGTIIDLWAGGRRLANCYWAQADEWNDFEEWRQQYSESPNNAFGIDYSPTHWMLLPEPPTPSQETQ